MQRHVLLTLVLLAAGFVYAPSLAHATGLPFYGPIVSTSGKLDLLSSCAGNWSALIFVLNNIIAFAVTITITFVAPLSIAYAGFLFVTGAGSSSSLTKAKGLLWNVIIGIVIALAGWLIVDLFLSTLTSRGLGSWTNAMFSTSGDICMPTYATLTPSGAPTAIGTMGSSTSTGSVTGGTNAQCASGNTACSPEALAAAGLTAAQANVMSCIAVTESSGNPATPPYNLSHPGSNSSACGTFQIVQSTWKGAASGGCSDFSNCQNAACNAQVMSTLVSQSDYSSWTCSGCNGKAQSCVNQYGGS